MEEGEGGDDDDDEQEQQAAMIREDAALAELVDLRKQQRKMGLLAALRRQLVIRSRSIDILEVCISFSRWMDVWMG